ncbi:hypothetical protein PLICRDRAFT_47250 [Plicaturopsis crispa FD-325 SS-3]|uniref:Uncharacterized protein n=1 Tax=Plicaturopsis crispa FD-325 SS-3 TaxID=944288 RepID=A0A0C9T284_PLICR|nr:hypothetical protein PLICRDRAFT_47250 [Plicaturopsis crispa FD-325 SS-3]
MATPEERATSATALRPRGPSKPLDEFSALWEENVRLRSENAKLARLEKQASAELLAHTEQFRKEHLRFEEKQEEQGRLRAEITRLSTLVEEKEGEWEEERERLMEWIEELEEDARCEAEYDRERWEDTERELEAERQWSKVVAEELEHRNGELVTESETLREELKRVKCKVERDTIAMDRCI